MVGVCILICKNVDSSQKINKFFYFDHFRHNFKLTLIKFYNIIFIMLVEFHSVEKELIKSNSVKFLLFNI